MVTSNLIFVFLCELLDLSTCDNVKNALFARSVLLYTSFISKTSLLLSLSRCSSNQGYLILLVLVPVSSLCQSLSLCFGYQIEELPTSRYPCLAGQCYCFLIYYNTPRRGSSPGSRCFMNIRLQIFTMVQEKQLMLTNVFF